MVNQATQGQQNRATEAALHVAFELSKSTWKLAFSDGKRRQPRVVTVDARDMSRVKLEVECARKRFKLTRDAVVYSCYEAGRDGFWLHRSLMAAGLSSIVVDAASIEVNRRARRTKTDRLDAVKLVEQLVRYQAGEKRVWSVVRVPRREDEDARQLHRELEVLKKERRQHRVRIQSLLFAQGIDQKVCRNFEDVIEAVRTWDGQPLPTLVKARILREYQRLLQVRAQMRDIEKQRKALLDSESTPAVAKVKLMAELCGIGIGSAWVFAMEFFGWRKFSNRREVAAAAGLTPTPYQSGKKHVEQGISKIGNKRVRTLMVEIAWCWLRFQPNSSLSRWYQSRFGHGSLRMRRVGIVALARRLLIALWRLVEDGVVPDGAQMA